MRIFRNWRTDAQRELFERIETAATTAICIPKKTLAREPELMNRKWFDYRFTTPMDATKMFFEEFVGIHKHFWDKRFDSATAGRKLGHGPISFVVPNRELTSFWEARQFADQHGIPYDKFLFWALEGFLDHGYRRIPRPNQLYAAKHRKFVTAGVLRKWEEVTGGTFRTSSLPQYRLEEFRNLPSQRAHQDWVVAQVRKQPRTALILAKVCFDTPVLHPDRARAEFGDEHLDRARRETSLSSPSPIFVSSSIVDVLPGCFAVPGAREPKNSVCSSCPYSGPCERAGVRALNRVEGETGSRQPQEDRHRAAGRDRTRRSRAREKERRRSGSMDRAAMS